MRSGIQEKEEEKEEGKEKEKGSVVGMHRRVERRRVLFEEKLILVMVGLPARGKSYIAKKVVSHLSWLGLRARLFNVGNLRRKVLQGSSQTSDFFSAENREGRATREQLAMVALDSLLHWLVGGEVDGEKEDECQQKSASSSPSSAAAGGGEERGRGGDVAVFDATNTTDERRRAVLQHCMEYFGAKGLAAPNVIFLECICDDEKVLRSNLKQKIRNSPDYQNMPYEQALHDLQQRIQNYQLVYRSISDDALSYIKLINLQSKVICNKIFGNRALSIATFLMSIHIGKRPIWLTRSAHTASVADMNKSLTPMLHDQLNHSSTDQNEEKATETGEKKGKAKMKTHPSLRQRNMSDVRLPWFEGREQADATTLKELSSLRLPSKQTMGDSLSEQGRSYAKKLAEFIQSKCSAETLTVHTSTLPRAVETAQYIPVPTNQWSALNMLDAGVCNDMSLANIKEQMPDFWESWMNNPAGVRFPGGESYFDVVRRLDTLVYDLERQVNPVLVVSHLSTLQVLYSYFVDCPVEKCPQLSIPRHTVIQLTPFQYGWKEERFDLGP
ncbi:6-phosphofructo-2-kinase/fructose-2, 6-bisphosphatase-like isoform X4 [Balamuthia mandrillaris]